MEFDSLHTRILDNLKTAILMLESNLVVSYINPSAEALLELSGSRILGDRITHLFSDERDACASLLDAIHNLTPYTRRETRLRLTSGRCVTVDCAVTPIAEDHRVSLVLELQPLDRLLRISREEGLLSSQQNTRALVRGLAHEVKNPLGGLRGAAQLLARELPAGQLTDYTRIIIEEADRLRNLVDRMLGPNRAPDLKPMNIHEVVERVRSLLEAESAGGIRFVKDYDPSIPEFPGDSEQLIQAVLNIVRNAVEALRAAAVDQPAITLRTRILRQFTIGAFRHRLVCRVEVIDNGTGIPADLLEGIFFPMVSGRPDGTGLGLSISQSIIGRHRGLIECDSRPGRTAFSIYLPLEANT